MLAYLQGKMENKMYKLSFYQCFLMDHVQDFLLTFPLVFLHLCEGNDWILVGTWLLFSLQDMK